MTRRNKERVVEVKNGGNEEEWRYEEVRNSTMTEENIEMTRGNKNKGVKVKNISEEKDGKEGKASNDTRKQGRWCRRVEGRQ